MGSAIRLITSVGIQRYNEAHYGLEGAPESSPYVSVALIRLLRLPEGQATVLLTKAAAEKHQAALEQALAEAGWTAEFRSVPEGGTEDEQMKTAAEVMDAVKSGEKILLDVTQGLRHFPFAYLAALTYLIGLQGNRLKGIYYGAYELRKKNLEGVSRQFTS